MNLELQVLQLAKDCLKELESFKDSKINLPYQMDLEVLFQQDLNKIMEDSSSKEKEETDKYQQYARLILFSSRDFMQADSALKAKVESIFEEKDIDSLSLFYASLLATNPNLLKREDAFFFFELIATREVHQAKLATLLACNDAVLDLPDAYDYIQTLAKKEDSRGNLDVFYATMNHPNILAQEKKRRDAIIEEVSKAFFPQFAYDVAINPYALALPQDGILTCLKRIGSIDKFDKAKTFEHVMTNQVIVERGYVFPLIDILDQIKEDGVMPYFLSFASDIARNPRIQRLEKDYYFALVETFANEPKRQVLWAMETAVQSNFLSLGKEIVIPVLKMLKNSNFPNIVAATISNPRTLRYAKEEILPITQIMTSIKREKEKDESIITEVTGRMAQCERVLKRPDRLSLIQAVASSKGEWQAKAILDLVDPSPEIGLGLYTNTLESLEKEYRWERIRDYSSTLMNIIAQSESSSALSITRILALKKILKYGKRPVLSLARKISQLGEKNEFWKLQGAFEATLKNDEFLARGKDYVFDFMDILEALDEPLQLRVACNLATATNVLELEREDSLTLIETAASLKGKDQLFAANNLVLDQKALALAYPDLLSFLPLYQKAEKDYQVEGVDVAIRHCYQLEPEDRKEIMTTLSFVEEPEAVKKVCEEIKKADSKERITLAEVNGWVKEEQARLALQKQENQKQEDAIFLDEISKIPLTNVDIYDLEQLTNLLQQIPEEKQGKVLQKSFERRKIVKETN